MPEEADRVVEAVADQVRAMHAGDFSDDEVERVKRYLAGSSLFDLQTVEQRAERLVDLERLGLPLDEPRAWPARVAGVAPERVRDAARRRLDPDGLFRVELGPVARRVRGPARRR
jgi:zinc protease